MHEVFTAAGQAVLAAAKEEARITRQHAVSTGHLLLSIATAAPNVGSIVLTELGASAEEIRRRLLARKPSDPVETVADLPYTDAASQSLVSAGREAVQAGSNETAPEHILLGLMNLETNTAQLIMRDLKIPEREVRSRIRHRLASSSPPHARNVFVIYGRDSEARRAMFDFLRTLDLRPQEWEEVVHISGSSAPFIGEAILRTFDRIQATIVLLTPDDIAKLHPDFHESRDARTETEPTGQARPNVLFEAGMAMMKMPERTIFVEFGEVRPFTDLAGRSTIRLSPDPVDTTEKLRRIVERLKSAGCPVNDSGSDWMNPAPFTRLMAHTRARNPVVGQAVPADS
ncbi:MAG TPA: hypothetical protein DGG94_08030 [Micromonosporaceae bacterium]|nr:hypothetical protein [Micromonosporaceae bacterium]HCU49734.1 hypothetical protein [Micromonosporaceae bacterium]